MSLGLAALAREFDINRGAVSLYGIGRIFGHAL
ncbi:hypothetical protein BDD14_3279 [Edaphobacter modestus]|uniref:Uncharacterized protein n=1 Tax=Edaphobacter modestus TaxID=388466 RepID=A0A4V6MFV3_9BACT|nr:hypothetical protein BDD14_3279 [Edaphobacter modestus]